MGKSAGSFLTAEFSSASWVKGSTNFGFDDVDASHEE
jgi:hypothetical protein